MTQTDTVTANHPTISPESEHFVCCEHEHVTLCGHYDPEGWNGNVSDEIECVVCQDLGDLDRCPVYGECKWERTS